MMYIELLLKASGCTESVPPDLSLLFKPVSVLYVSHSSGIVGNLDLYLSTRAFDAEGINRLTSLFTFHKEASLDPGLSM